MSANAPPARQEFDWASIHTLPLLFYINVGVDTTMEAARVVLAGSKYPSADLEFDVIPAGGASTRAGGTVPGEPACCPPDRAVV